MNVQRSRSQAGAVIRVSVARRNELVASVVARAAMARSEGRRALLFIGDCGVSSHEFGEVRGVCPEVPLPRVAVLRRQLLLDGVGGMAGMLRTWGMPARVVCPMGHHRFASLQKKLLHAKAIPALELRVANPQHFRYIQRVYAEGHQLTHIETVESIPSAAAATASECLRRIAKSSSSAALLCVVDSGNAGIDAACFKELVSCAKRHRTPVFYEPRTPALWACSRVDVIKLNYNQMREWFGSDVSCEADALRASRALLDRTGARTVFYTRGDRGLVVCQRLGGGAQGIVVEPNEKNMFDTVAAGDIVTAALAYCLARRYPAIEAACFAAAAAERALERRGSKQLALSDLLNSDFLQ